jgi:hypothetical protein
LAEMRTQLVFGRLKRQIANVEFGIAHLVIS